MTRGRSLLALAVLILASVPARSAQSPSPIHVAVAARTLQPGELVVLTITLQEVPTSVHVSAFGRDVPVFAQREHVWIALVGIDLDQRPGAYVATVEAQGASAVPSATVPLVVAPRAFPTRHLRVDPSFVSPSATALARIAQDAAFLRGVYAQSAGERLWSGMVVRPVDGPATSSFGTRSLFNGERRRPHGGTDFLSAAGTPIQAPLAGRVLAARDLYFTGSTVVIDHGLGLLSLMAHLSRLDVHEGDRVDAGQMIGLVGATGRVTGPHLHWALTVSGARVDPLSALALLGHD